MFKAQISQMSKIVLSGIAVAVFWKSNLNFNFIGRSIKSEPLVCQSWQIYQIKALEKLSIQSSL